MKSFAFYINGDAPGAPLFTNIKIYVFFSYKFHKKKDNKTKNYGTFKSFILKIFSLTSAQLNKKIFNDFYDEII